MEKVEMQDVVIDRKTRAIICFGPATPVTGYKAGDYFQVLIDPCKQSPGGDYIRFDPSDECEVCGWQRISALTICEILQGSGEELPESVTMRAITKE